jgi:hypothetical protein
LTVMHDILPGTVAIPATMAHLAARLVWPATVVR